MLYLRDISNIKCDILEQFQIISILAEQDLYWLAQTIVLFGMDRTLWIGSVLIELSPQTGPKGFSDSMNHLLLSNFITSNYPLVLTLLGPYKRVRMKRASQQKQS